MSRHDADFAGVRADDAGAIGADQTGLVLAQKMPFHFRHVLLGNSFRDTHD